MRKDPGPPWESQDTGGSGLAGADPQGAIFYIRNYFPISKSIFNVQSGIVSLNVNLSTPQINPHTVYPRESQREVVKINHLICVSCGDCFRLLPEMPGKWPAAHNRCFHKLTPWTTTMCLGEGSAGLGHRIIIRQYFNAEKQNSENADLNRS